LFLDALRLNPAVDMGATLAEMVRGKGSKASALAFLPFLGWGKKAKAGVKLGSELVSEASRLTHLPEAARVGEAAASALKSGERSWAQSIGGRLRAAPPMPFSKRVNPGQLAGDLSVPFFQQYPRGNASSERLAEEMWANLERFSK
jgi:hypothetical protein